MVISEVGGTRVYVNTTASGALGVRAEDGQLLWTYPIDKTTAVIPTPIVRGDLVFFTAGYNRGGALLRQVPGGNGEVKVEAVYPLNTDLNNKHGGVILVGDYLYGDSNDQGTPFCAELMTGKIVWKERGPGKKSASVTAADGHLYIRWADGTMALAKASPDGFTSHRFVQDPRQRRPPQLVASRDRRRQTVPARRRHDPVLQRGQGLNQPVSFATDMPSLTLRVTVRPREIDDGHPIPDAT